MRRYKIVDIHQRDMFYPTRDRYIGVKVIIIGDVRKNITNSDYQSMLLELPDGVRLYFFAVKLSPNPLEES